MATPARDGGAGRALAQCVGTPITAHPLGWCWRSLRCYIARFWSMSHRGRAPPPPPPPRSVCTAHPYQTSGGGGGSLPCLA